MPTLILLHVISYYTNLEEMSTWLHMCGELAMCLRCQWVCEVCSRVCFEKKENGKREVSKWLGSVSVTVNLLNHLPPSNKIEHQAELNNCQTPRHHPNREEISSKKEGREHFSREGELKYFNAASHYRGRSDTVFGQGELKEPLSGKSSLTFISWGDRSTWWLRRHPGSGVDIHRMLGKGGLHTYWTLGKGG